MIFEVQGCQNCHGGKNWTISAIDYTPPPAANEVVDAQPVRFLCRVGTFDPSLFTANVSNEIRANTLNVNVQARGALGFNVPVAHLGLQQWAVPAQRRRGVARRRARKRDAPHRGPR